MTTATTYNRAPQAFAHYYSAALAILKTGETAMIVAETFEDLSSGSERAWVETFNEDNLQDYEEHNYTVILLPVEKFDANNAQASMFPQFQPKYNQLLRNHPSPAKPATPAQPALVVTEETTPAQPAPVVTEETTPAQTPAPVVTKETTPAQPAPVVTEETTPAQPALVVTEETSPAQPAVETTPAQPAVETTPAQPAQPAPGGQSLLDWLIGLFGLDQKTIDLANNYIKGGNAITIFEASAGTLRGKVQKNSAGAWYSASVVNGKHQCSCRDAADNTKPLPCKHVVSIAIAFDNGQGVTSQATPAQPPAPRQPSQTTPAQPAQPRQPIARPAAPATVVTGFQQKVSRRIADAIISTAKRLQSMIAEGLIPIMLGPTGVGKSSAARYLAQLFSAGYEEICLNSSFTEGDLYGIVVNSTTRIEGVIARSFRRARNGEVMVVNIDEFYRGNRRIQDLFMGLLLPVDPATAKARGIDTNEPVFIGESAVWGLEWAPCSRIKWVMGANPWGQTIDPAFARRVQPLQVGFDEKVLEPFCVPFRDKVKEVWNMVGRNELPIPLDYSQVARCKNDNDESIFPPYLDKLAMIDNSPQRTLMSKARSVLCPIITP